MKLIVQVQFAPWDKIYYFDPKNHELKIGDQVIVKTELGTEIGKIIGWKELEESKKLKKIEEIKPILRKATLTDLEKVKEKQSRANVAFKSCQKLIKKHNLPMKLIDVCFSFDGRRVTFAFISKEKIDFRELVKELNRKFQKSIRFHQIEVRQGVKITGDIGLCGRELCCLKFLKNPGQISSSFIFDQQLTHRGAERLSGPCGRLICCLAFEECYYQEMMKKLPVIGSIVKTEYGSGEVVDWHILKQTIGVKVNEDTIVEIPIEEIKR